MKIASEMTLIVLGGALNSTPSQIILACNTWHAAAAVLSVSVSIYLFSFSEVISCYFVCAISIVDVFANTLCCASSTFCLCPVCVDMKSEACLLLLVVRDSCSC